MPCNDRIAKLKPHWYPNIRHFFVSAVSNENTPRRPAKSLHHGNILESSLIVHRDVEPVRLYYSDTLRRDHRDKQATVPFK